MDPLISHCQAVCEQHNLLPQGSTVVIAVSGGIDSLVLLHVLHQLQKPLDLTLHIATLDHGLRGADGAADAARVAEIAGQLGLPCTRHTINVPQLMNDYELGVEEAARLGRYTFLFQVALQNSADCIALAHQHDDQAETVLMHLIRGSGLHGLQGMAYESALSEEHLLPDWAERLGLSDDDDIMPDDLVLIRPLLGVGRPDIVAYAERYNIQPCTDTTNTDTRLFRNAIREEVLPLLAQFNPNITTTLNRLATIVQGDLTIIDREVDNTAAWMFDWSDTVPDNPTDEGGEVVFIDREAFAEESVGMQRRLIRKAIMDLAVGISDLSFDLVERARQMVLSGQTNTSLPLLDDITLRIGYDEVLIGYGGDPAYPVHLPYLQPGRVLQVNLDQEAPRLSVGKLELVMYWVVAGRSTDWHPPDPLECTLAIPNNATITIRTWQSGDRFRPFGMNGHSQKLSDTFTNLKVPVYYRDQVPLLMINNEIAWIVAPTASGPKARIADPFAVRDAGANILRLRWQPPSLLPLP